MKDLLFGPGRLRDRVSGGRGYRALRHHREAGDQRRLDPGRGGPLDLSLEMISRSRRDRDEVVRFRPDQER